MAKREQNPCILGIRMRRRVGHLQKSELVWKRGPIEVTISSTSGVDHPADFSVFVEVFGFPVVEDWKATEIAAAAFAERKLFQLYNATRGEE